MHQTPVLRGSVVPLRSLNPHFSNTKKVHEYQVKLERQPGTNQIMLWAVFRALLFISNPLEGLEQECGLISFNINLRPQSVENVL